MRVMPLGDSITDGLAAAGRLPQRPVAVHDRRRAERGLRRLTVERARRSSATATRRATRAGGSRSCTRTRAAGCWGTGPDVVLLHIGTNDVIQRSGLQAAPRRLGALVDLITTTLPSAHVYVATITPLADPANERRVRAFNAAVPGLVARRRRQGPARPPGRHARRADRQGHLRRRHPPDNGGYSKMAARWYSALTGVPMTRWEAEKTAYTTVNNGERLTTGTASGNGKVGYLSAPEATWSTPSRPRATARTACTYARATA